jgi:hypothetical protein
VLSGYYPPGTLGHLAGGRPLLVVEAFREARRLAAEGQEIMLGAEAMSTSDFRTYLNSINRHSFQSRLDELLGAYDQFTSPLDVNDFETYTASRFGRFPDVPQKPLNGEYRLSALRELPGPSYKLIEWGDKYAITRQLILADSLQKLTDLPELKAEAVARTKSKRAVAVLESGFSTNDWDGNPPFSSAHGNRGTTALTATMAGAAALQAAFLAIDTQTDAEGYLVNNPKAPKILIVPRVLQEVAENLRDYEQLPVDGTATALMRPNPVRGKFTVVVEWYLTDDTNWYVIVGATNPKTATIVRLRLRGADRPYIGIKDSDTRGLLGNPDDPYSFPFDEEEVKCRDDFDFVFMDWRSAYGSEVAGS